MLSKLLASTCVLACGLGIASPNTLAADTTSTQNSNLSFQTEVPISRIAFPTPRTGLFVVPGRNTTASAYGGDLRLYDVHIAKMFEITHHECNLTDIPQNSIDWKYQAGDGDIEMGTFTITCSLANSIATEYGLGQTEATEILYYRARSTVDIPILNITGEKIPQWLDFVASFEPN